MPSRFTYACIGRGRKAAHPERKGEAGEGALCALHPDTATDMAVAVHLRLSLRAAEGRTPPSGKRSGRGRGGRAWDRTRDLSRVKRALSR
jgi:hypothetical protein